MYQTITPFLDNIETVGIHKDAKSDTLTREQKTLSNNKRANRNSLQARSNAKHYKEVNSYIMSGVLDNHKAHDVFINYKANIQSCGTHSLFREYTAPYAVEYIGAHTCKHKLCNICNSERSKMIRRKYRTYINKNEFIDKQTGEIQSIEDFDSFHLTLTVPHSEKGFRGKHWYADELIKEFNYLRKKDFWKQHVWGGEFGIEATKHDNGLHIHIHSLLIVRKSLQNRNELHREILLNWNMQTVDEKNSRENFNESDFEKMLTSNKKLTLTDLHELNPKGSTIMGLESLFVLTKQPVSKYDKLVKEKNLYKHYVNCKEPDGLMSGIMECIKYHFEPMALNKEDNTLDFDLLAEILPAIKGKPLHRKFGNLHGVKELNVNESIESQIEDIINEVAEDNITHPDTGEPVTSTGFRYSILSLHSIFCNREKNFRICIKKSARKKELKDHTLKQALLHMLNLSIKNPEKSKTKDKHYMSLDNELFMQFDEFNLN